LLLGQKPGDNGQVQALAEALGWPYESRRFVYRRTELVTNRLLGPTLAGVVGSRSSTLEPPWPDLVISAGRRNEPIARWIQRRADRRVRLVHLGRPWASLDRFDLIITTPQYLLPDRPNVLRNAVPLHRITAARLAEAGATLEPHLAGLPHPYIAVLIGGNSGDFNFDPPTAARLGRRASAMAMAVGGTLLITTSARTPAEAAAAFEAAIDDVPARLFHWTSEAADNPYLGYLALADAFIVTADSVSMVTEACVTRKPVHIFDPVEMRNAGSRGGLIGAPTVKWPRLRFRNVIQWLSMRVGPRRMRRDVKAIHRRLIAEGRAVWLGDEFPGPARSPPLRDVERAVQRVRGLFDPG
jgi:mitochondrial fission protein ELM1